MAKSYPTPIFWAHEELMRQAETQPKITFENIDTFFNLQRSNSDEFAIPVAVQ